VRLALAARGSQSRVADLLEIQAFNDVIDQVGRITANMQTRVSDYLESHAQSAGHPDWDAAVKWSGDVHNELVEAVGSWNVDTYQRLKVSTIGQMFAEDLCDAFRYPDSVQQASFLRAVISAWMDGTEFWSASTLNLKAFLDASDMPYRERRVRFLLQAVNDLYDPPAGNPPPPESLNALKDAGWSVLNDLLSFRAATATKLTTSAATFLDAAHLGSRAYTDPSAFAADHADDLQTLVATYQRELATYQRDAAKTLWAVFTEQTQDWSTAHRNELLYRWVGFALWDALIFPVIALSRLPQLNPIQMQRLSPLDNTMLQLEDEHSKAIPKLLGRKVHHFGGFFSREWRENDYLWGRLDGVAQLLAMLGEKGWTKTTSQAFTAALDQEAETLATAKDTIGKIRDVIAAHSTGI
jgi:hypothetical protein